MNTRDTDRTETELRDAVHAYGESVRPDDRLGAIRARTQGGRASGARAGVWWRRPWALAAGVGAVATSVVLGAIVLVGPEPAGTEAPAVAGAGRDVTVYEVGEVGGRPWLYPEQVTTENTGDPALDAVRALLGHEPTGDRFTLWTDLCAPGQRPQSVVVRDRVVTADFAEGGGYTCDLTSQRVYKALQQQLAWTLRRATDIDRPVQVTIDGRPMGQPVSADPSAVSPILIDSPADGAMVSGPVTVRGTSDTSEATVTLVVDPADGGTVRPGATIGSGGTMGERAPFRFTVELAPGDYTARAYAESAEDGSLVAEDTTTFTVE